MSTEDREARYGNTGEWLKLRSPSKSDAADHAALTHDGKNGEPAQPSADADSKD